MKDKLFFDIQSLCDQEFFQNSWKKDFKIWRGALKEQLFGFDKLNETLNTFEFSTEDLRLVRDNEFFNMQRLVEKNAHDSKHRLNRFSKIDTLKLNETLRKDTYSIRLFSLSKYDGKIKEFSRYIEGLTNRRCDSLGIYTPEGQKAFDWHADDFDGFAVQTEGRKTWRIAAPGKDGSDGDFREFTLEKGDVLYFPEAIVHQAFTQDSASLHVTFALRELELRELWNVLMHQADNPLFTSRFSYESEGFGLNAQKTKKRLRDGMVGLNKFFNEPRFSELAKGLLLGGIEKQKPFINLPYPVGGMEARGFRFVNTEEAVFDEAGESKTALVFRGRKFIVNAPKAEVEELAVLPVLDKGQIKKIFNQSDIVQLLIIGFLEEV